MSAPPLRATASSGSQSSRSVKDADLDLDEQFKQDLRSVIESKMTEMVKPARDEYDEQIKVAKNDDERKQARANYDNAMSIFRAIADEQFKGSWMVERHRRLGTSTYPIVHSGSGDQYAILEEVHKLRARRQETGGFGGGGPNGREPSNLRHMQDDVGAEEALWFRTYTPHSAAYPSPVEPSLPAPIPIGRTDNIDSFTQEEVAHSFGAHAGVGRKPSTGSLSSIRSRPEWPARANGSPNELASSSRAYGYAASPGPSIPARRDSGSSNVLNAGISSSVPRSSSPPAAFGLNRRDSNASVGSSRSGRRRDSDSRNFTSGTYSSISTPPPPSPFTNAAAPAYPYAPSSSQPGASPTKKDARSTSFLSGLSATAPRAKSSMPPILSPPPPPAPPSLSYRQNIDVVDEEAIQPQRTGDERERLSYGKGKDAVRGDGYKPSWVHRQPSTNDFQQPEHRTNGSPAPVVSPASTDYPMTPESYRQPSNFMNPAMRRQESEEIVGIPIKARGLALDDQQSSSSPEWHKSSPVASISRSMGRKMSFDPEHRPRNPSTSPIQSRMQYYRPVRRRTSISSYRSGRSSRSQSTRPEFPIRAATEDWSQMPMATYEERSQDDGSDQSDMSEREWEDIYDEEEITRREAEAAQKERETLQKLEELKKREEELVRKEEEARRKEDLARQKEEDVRQKEDLARRREDEVRRKEEIARRREADARRKEEEAMRKAEEARKMEEGAKKKEEDARKLEEDARKKEEDARKKEEDARRMELDARRIEAEARRKEAQAEKLEETLKRMSDEAQKRIAELKRKEEDARRKEEEARRREEDARRKEEDARRKEEDARKKEEDARRREDDAREKSEEARQRVDEAKQRTAEAWQRAEEARVREELLMRKEEEVNQKESDLCRREEELERREAESRRQDEERRTEEYFTDMARHEQKRMEEVLAEQARIAAELRAQTEARKQAEELAERLQKEEERRARDLAIQEDRRRAELRQKEEERRKAEALAEERRAAEALAEEERKRAVEEERRKAEAIAAQEEVHRRQEEEMQRQQRRLQEEEEEVQRQHAEFFRKQEEEMQRQAAADLRRRQEEARRLQEFRQQQQQKEEETRRLQEFARHQEELRKRQENATAGQESIRTNTPYSSASHPYARTDRYSTTSTGSNGSTSSTWSNATSGSSWSNKSSATSGSQTSAGSGSARTATGAGWRSASTAPFATPEAASGARRSGDEDRAKAWRERQEEQAQKQAEAFMREQERMERERATRASKVLSKEDVLRLFDEHERMWIRIPTLDVLSWNSFAWPVLRRPSTPEELTTVAISAYVLNPNNPSDKSDKDRIKEHIRRWHPDRFETKLLSKVRADEREKVKEGAGQVVRSLNELLRQT